MEAKGKVYESERKTFKDVETGREITQITNFPGHHNKLYITTHSWTTDGRNIVFLAQRGSPVWNLFKIEVKTGRITRLTEENNPVNPYTPIIDVQGDLVWYHSEDDSLKTVNIETLEERVVRHLPAGWRWCLCLDQALNGGEIQARIQTDNCGWNPTTRIVMMDRDGRNLRQVLEERVHPGLGISLRPNSAGEIVYSKYDQGELWAVNVNGENKRKLHGLYNDIWITHPIWLNDQEIAFNEWPHALRKVDMNGKATTISEFNYFHPSASPDGTKLVCDTSHPNTGIYLVDADTGRRELLCHDGCVSVGGGQWGEPRAYPVVHPDPWHLPYTHVHPSFNRDGSEVLFNSNRGGGHMQLFVVKL